MLFPTTSPPPTPPRVVITGAGIVTALGRGWKPNAEGFRAGRTAFRPVSLFDVSRQRARNAAEVDLPATLPSTRLSAKQMARFDRAAAMLLLATHEAWQQSGWEPAENLPFVLGTTAGGMSFGEAYFRQAVQTPLRHRHQPTRAVYYQPQVPCRRGWPWPSRSVTCLTKNCFPKKKPSSRARHPGGGASSRPAGPARGLCWPSSASRPSRSCAARGTNRSGRPG